MSVKCELEVTCDVSTDGADRVRCSDRLGASFRAVCRSPTVSLAAAFCGNQAGVTARVPPTAWPPRPQRGVPPARAARRSARSEALADPAPPLPALAGPVAAGRDRAHLRARLHGAVARDPDPGPAHDRQRDRRRRHLAAPPLPRADHRASRPSASASTSPAATRRRGSGSRSRRGCAG